MSDTAATAATASGPTTAETAAADAAAAAAAPPAPPPSFAKGNLVSHSWTDDYDGEQTRYGIVVDVPDAERVTVAWLTGTATMPADTIAGA